MDRHIDPINNCVSREFKEGVDFFIPFASNQTSFIEGKTMLCPCARCQNRKQRDSRTVSRHLYRVEFKICFIPSPRVRGTSAKNWWACTKVVPKGVLETSEVALTALQDDRHNQVVARSEMLRFETYVVEDDSDYDSMPVVPPNDEYVSEDELQPSYVRNMRPQMRTASMPPGTTTASAQPTRPPGVVGSSTSSAAPPPPPPPPTYERRTEEALLRAPSRINQPHLHPDKINGALWIEVDPEVHEFIKATWQGNYWGPWQSWQQYYWEERFHEETYFKWKLRTQVTICGRISQKRQKNKEPSYISATDWETILANWSTPEAKAKSQSASMHVHGAGPRTFANIAYKMVSFPSLSTFIFPLFNCLLSNFLFFPLLYVVDEGFEEPVSYPDLVRKSHTRKDGTFIDERAEALVLEVKQAVEEMLQEGSPGGDSQTDSTAATTISKRLLLNQEYTRGTIYGLGNLQYKNKRPSESVPAALKRDIDIEMRVSGLESLTQEIKFDVHALKTDFNEGIARITSNAQPSQSQHHSPSHSEAQPQGQAQPEGHGQAPSPPHDQPQAPGDAQPHLITDNHSALDRWCNAELGL
ncbi:hypothetical protein HID58_047057 [Brassica napus]|uniref:Transposase-associated domain-containing protein n=1 Tax=Brassica napus TaxID=3708 RepID=A0ABQ8AY54_BRANA|nr:hypothetical protein HID58_047057 [Brassica napus]